MENKNNHKKIPNNPINKLALQKARAIAPKYCEQCGAMYQDSNFKLVQENPNSLIFHLKCNKCGSTYILNVVAPNPNILASQKSKVLLDLQDSSEFTKFAGQPPVKIDEALDVFNELQKTNIKDILKRLGK